MDSTEQDLWACRWCGGRFADVAPGMMCTECVPEPRPLVPEPELNARPNDPLLGALVGGRFAVYAFLGEGGFGAVYRAVQTVVGRQVALKVILPGGANDDEARARFFREARIVTTLTHPCVVRLYEYGVQPDGLVYNAFEFVRGVPLGDALRFGGAFEPSRAVALILPVLAALGEAHAAGLVHRDVKPDNLMLQDAGSPLERLRLLDFGVSKSFGAELDGDTLKTQHGLVMGTPRYMAPEQAGGRGADGRADLYSVGTVLYELLAGRPPFMQVNPFELVMAQLNEAVPPLPERSGLTPALRAAVMRALEKSPTQRWQTAGELEVALRAALGEMDSPNATETPPMSQTPRAPRSGAPLLPIALGAAALVAGLGWLLLSGDKPATPAPSDEPVKQVITVGEPVSSARPIEPPTAAATLPMQPWERAIEYGGQGRTEEAAAQILYLMRASKDPASVYQRAKGDARLAKAIAHPMVQSALPPDAPR
jgi:serine/threonine protein kinase